MKVNAQARFKKLEQAFERLADRGVRSVEPDSLRNEGLRRLAAAVSTSVSTGCGGGGPSKAKLSDMRRVLGSVGKQIKQADKDKDGKLSDTERRALSSLAKDLLLLAEHVRHPAKPAYQPSGSGSTGGSGARVRTGC